MVLGGVGENLVEQKLSGTISVTLGRTPNKRRICNLNRLSLVTRQVSQ